MKGLELSENYYKAFGEPMLANEFGHLSDRIAVGMAGAGSECLGFDDETSADHDFGPGFMIFLPGEDEVSRRDAFLLERAYAKLPKEFMGFQREYLSPAGGNRFGVIRRDEFFLRTVGSADGSLTLHEWMTIPEQSLLEATSGRVFFDGDGAFSAIRKRIDFFPEDVLLKKLSGALYTMGQSGPYNFSRCVSHAEPGSAMLSLTEFVKASLHVLFLLNGRYMPYYKWVFRAASELDHFSETMSPQELGSFLSALLTEGISDVAEKTAAIDQVASETVSAVRSFLKERGCVDQMTREAQSTNPYRLTTATSGTEEDDPDLGTMAEKVNRLIKDPYLRSLPVAGIGA